MKIQVLHKSDKEQDGLWYEIDEVLYLEEARKLTIHRAQVIANNYLRTTRIVDVEDIVYCYIDPMKDK